DFFVQQHADVALAVENLVARLAYAYRAERVGFARPAEGRLRLLIRLQQRLVGPFRDERRVLTNPVHRVEHDPGAVRRDGESLLDVFDGRVHHRLLSTDEPAVPARLGLVNDRARTSWPITLSVNWPQGHLIGQLLHPTVNRRLDQSPIIRRHRGSRMKKWFALSAVFCFGAAAGAQR